MSNKPFEIETLRFNDGTIQTTAYTAPQQRGYFAQLTHSGDNNRAAGEAVVIDADNNSYVSYSYYDENLSKQLGGIVKFNASGEKVWSRNIQSANTNSDVVEIASLELVETGIATMLMALGTYYDNVQDLSMGVMYFISTEDGTIITGPTSEFGSYGGVVLRDGVSNGNGAVVVGYTYNELIPKTITPIAPSGVDRLYITWADFAATGLVAGNQLIYNTGNYYGVSLNSADVVATPDGTGYNGIYLNVRTTEAGEYVIVRSNGWNDLSGWTVPISLRVLGSTLGGTDGVNDLTFDFDRTVFNNNSNNLQAAISNIAGTPISNVFGTGFNGHNWGSSILTETGLGSNGSANQLLITIADYPGITAVQAGWKINGPGIVDGRVNTASLSDSYYVIDTGDRAITAGELYTFTFNGTVTLQYQLNEQAYIAQMGEVTWAKNLGAQDSERINSVVQDNSGGVYVAGQYYDPVSNKSGLVAKYDSESSQQWAVRVDAASYTGVEIFSIDLLADGNVITVGDRGLVTKLDSGSGSIVWQVSIGGSISWDSDFKGTATPTGDYIFTNYEDNDYTLYVMRLSGADGSVMWSKRISRALGPVTGEIYPQDNFRAQYIDCNSEYVTIAASTYIYLNNNSANAGLVITLPIDGENIDGVYGEYIISAVDLTWVTETTTATAATIAEQSATVETGSATPTSAPSDIVVARTVVGDAVAAGANTGDITFSGVEIRGAVTNGNYGAIKLVPNIDVNYTNAGQFLAIYPTTNQDAPHIHIAAGTVNGNTGDLILGSDTYNLDVNHDGTVRINTSGPHQWKFDATGALTLPSGGGPGGGGFVQTVNGYPTLLAYGAGGHGGPELDWADTDNINSVFFDNTVLRHTMYLNNDGLYIGMNQNGKANVFSGDWTFGTDGVLKLPAGGDIVDSNTVSVLSGRYAPQSVPSSSPGRVGDKYGMIAVTTQWLYICTRDYTGDGGNIWRRIATDSDYTWTN